MGAEYGVFELLMMPVAFMLGSSFCLYIFNGLISFTKAASQKSFAKGGNVLAVQVQKYMAIAKPYLDLVLPSSTFTITLTDILLCAVLMAVLGLWQTQYLAKKQLVKNGETCKTACKPASSSKKSE